MSQYEKKDYVPIRVASSITGIKEQTLRKLHEASILKGYRTPANQRMFCVKSLQRMCQQDDTTKESKVNFERVNILYSRVSSKKQIDDLERQVKFLEQYKREGVDYLVISDVGSGINFNRKGVNEILEYCLQRSIGEVIIAHRDRLSRFGFDLFKSIITKAGGSITVIDDQKNKSTEQELAEDLLSIVHIYSCKQMGRRTYTKNKREGRRETSENILCENETDKESESTD